MAMGNFQIYPTRGGIKSGQGGRGMILEKQDDTKR